MESKYDAVMLYGGGLDSGALLHHLYRTHAVDPERLLLLSYDYGQVAWPYENKARVAILNYYRDKGAHFASKVVHINGLYFGLEAAGGPGVTNLLSFGRGNQDDRDTIPWRNYILTFAAAAYCAQGYIPTMYLSVGHSDANSWDAKDHTFHDLQSFIEHIAQSANQFPQEIIGPVAGIPRAEGIIREIKHGFPWEHTWSCWFYEGYKDGDLRPYAERFHNKHPCGKCVSCLGRQAILEQAGVWS